MMCLILEPSSMCSGIIMFRLPAVRYAGPGSAVQLVEGVRYIGGRHAEARIAGNAVAHQGVDRWPIASMYLK